MYKMHPKRQRGIFCLLTIGIIISFLWADLVWAGGLECYKLASTSQVTSLVPVAKALETGERGLREALELGRPDSITGIPCLVFSDSSDKSRFSYYIFNPLESYFSRITTHPDVNDPLWRALGRDRPTISSEKRELTINKDTYYQEVFILSEEETRFIDICLVKVYGDRYAWKGAGKIRERMKRAGVFRPNDIRNFIERINGLLTNLEIVYELLEIAFRYDAMTEEFKDEWWRFYVGLVEDLPDLLKKYPSPEIRMKVLRDKVDTLRKELAKDGLRDTQKENIVRNNISAWLARMNEDDYTGEFPIDTFGKYTIEPTPDIKREVASFRIEPFSSEDTELMKEWGEYKYYCWEDAVRGVIEGFKLVTIDKLGKKRIEGWVVFEEIIGEGLYEAYLENAPWNRGDEREIKGIATALEKRLVEESISRGYKGRIISIPESEDGIRFSKATGKKPTYTPMTQTGRTTWSYWTLSSKGAVDFLDNYVHSATRDERQTNICLLVGGSGGGFLGSVLRQVDKNRFSILPEEDLQTTVIVTPFDDGGGSRRLQLALKDYIGYFPSPGDRINILANMATVAKRDVLRFRTKGWTGTLKENIERLLKEVEEKGDDWDIFCRGLLEVAGFLDEKFVKKGLLSPADNTIGNFLEVGIAIMYGAYNEGKIVDIKKHDRACRELYRILGLPDIGVMPVSFDEGTLYVKVRYPTICINHEIRSITEGDIKKGQMFVGGIVVYVSKRDDGAIVIGINNDSIVVKEEFGEVVSNDSRTVVYRDNQPIGILSTALVGDEDDPYRLEGNRFDVGGVEVKLRGRLVIQQTNITETLHLSPIDELGFINGVSPKANPIALDTIRNTKDIICVGPGSLFTSLLCLLFIPDIVDALVERRREGLPTVFIFNPTRDNETVGATYEDIIDYVERITGKRFEELFSHVILNDMVEVVREAIDSDKRDEILEVLNTVDEVSGREREILGMGKTDVSVLGKYYRGLMGLTEDGLKELKEMAESGIVPEGFKLGELERVKEIFRKREIKTIIAPLVVVDKEAREDRLKGGRQWGFIFNSKKMVDIFNNLKVWINPNIFRVDIRGIAERDLTDPVVERLGKAYGTWMRRKLGDGPINVVVGHDVRLSSPNIHKVLIDAIISTGVNVIDIGVVSTPALYDSISAIGEEITGGVMVTGTHLGAEYNGLKPLMGTSNLTQEELWELYKLAVTGDFIEGSGSLEKSDVLPSYTERLRQAMCQTTGKDLPLEGMRIVVDVGNGTTGFFIRLLEDLGASVVGLYPNPDGGFTHHSPDLEDRDNLAELTDIVKKTGAILGIAFDADGGRSIFVDEDGDIITGNEVLMILSNLNLRNYPGGAVVLNSNASNSVLEYIESIGGKPILWKTVYTNIRRKMIELKGQGQHVALGGETFGHMLFPENSYFDDGIYTAVKFLAAISSMDKRERREINGKLELYYISESMRLSVSTEEAKRRVVEDIRRYYEGKGYPILELDGPRITFKKEKGWALVRPSETETKVVVTVEAETRKGLERILREIELLLRAYPEVDLRILQRYIEDEFGKKPRFQKKISFRPMDLRNYSLARIFERARTIEEEVEAHPERWRLRETTDDAQFYTGDFGGYSNGIFTSGQKGDRIFYDDGEVTIYWTKAQGNTIWVKARSESGEPMDLVSLRIDPFTKRLVGIYTRANLDLIAYKLGRIEKSPIYFLIKKLLVLPEDSELEKRIEWLGLLGEIYPTLSKANSVQKTDPDSEAAGLIDKLVTFRYYPFWRIRYLAFSAIERLSRIKPRFLPKKRLKEIGRLFLEEDIRRDLLAIRAVFNTDSDFLRKAFRLPELKTRDIKQIKVEYLDRGKEKQIYIAELHHRDGREFRIALAPVRLTSDPILFGEITLDSETKAMKMWERLVGVAPDLVPGLRNWEHLGDLERHLLPWSATGKRIDWEETLFLVARDFVEGLTLQEVVESEFSKEETYQATIEAIKTYLRTWLLTRDEEGKGIFLGDPKPDNVILKRIKGGFGNGCLFDLEHLYSDVILEHALGILSLYYSKELITEALFGFFDELGYEEWTKVLQYMPEEYLVRIKEGITPDWIRRYFNTNRAYKVLEAYKWAEPELKERIKGIVISFLKDEEHSFRWSARWTLGEIIGLPLQHMLHEWAQADKVWEFYEKADLNTQELIELMVESALLEQEKSNIRLAAEWMMEKIRKFKEDFKEIIPLIHGLRLKDSEKVELIRAITENYNRDPVNYNLGILVYLFRIASGEGIGFDRLKDLVRLDIKDEILEEASSLWHIATYGIEDIEGLKEHIITETGRRILSNIIAHWIKREIQDRRAPVETGGVPVEVMEPLRYTTGLVEMVDIKDMADVFKDEGYVTEFSPLYMWEHFFSMLKDTIEVKFIFRLGDSVRLFTVRLPKEPDEGMDKLVDNFIFAYIYNLMVARGAESIGVYTVDETYTERLLDKISKRFPLKEKRDKRGKPGYTHVRPMLKMIYGVEVKFYKASREEIEAIEYPNVNVITETDLPLLHALKNPRGIIAGVDAGGTDIKVVLYKDNRLVYSKEHNWDPGSFKKAEEHIGTVEILIKFCLIKIKLEEVRDTDLIRDLVEFSDPRTGIERIREFVSRVEDKYGRDIYNSLDAVGISWPEVVVSGRMVPYSGKVEGLDRLESPKREQELEKIGRLRDEISRRFGDIPVEITNDGSIGAFWGSVELGKGNLVGISLGTACGVGFIDRGGNITDMLTEMGKVVLNLADDPTTIHDLTGVLGGVQKHLSQKGVFRVADKLGLDAGEDVVKLFVAKDYAKRYWIDISGVTEGDLVEYVSQRLDKKDRDDYRKALTSKGEKLRYIQSLLDSSDEVIRQKAGEVFKELGRYLACFIEQIYLYFDESGTRNIVLFGRVIDGVAGGIIIKTARDFIRERFPWLPEINIYLSTDLTDNPDADRLGQAIGAVYLGYKRLVEERIYRLVRELNSREIRPKINNKNLIELDTPGLLLRHITDYTPLKDPIDIIKILEARLEGGDLFLYNAIFNQREFLEGLDRPINIAMFRGGRGVGELTRLLKDMPNVNISCVLGGTDDGRSWYHAAQDFNATGVPDCGKTLLDLARDMDVAKLLETRLKGEDARLKIELKNLIGDLSGGHTKIKPEKAQWIAKYLREFMERLQKEFSQTKFSLNNIPIRSLVLLGAAWYYEGNWQRAIDEVAGLLDIKSGNRIAFSTQERMHLVGLTVDGTIYFTETGINEHPKREDFIGLWLFKKKPDIDNIARLLLMEGVVLESVEVPSNMPHELALEVSETSRVIRQKGKVDEVALILSRLSYDEVGDIVINPVAMDVIQNADLIIYGPSSLESNIASGLLASGFKEMIQANRDAVKIFFVNPTIENEPIGTTAWGMLGKLYRYITRQQPYRIEDAVWEEGFIDYILGRDLQNMPMDPRKRYVPFDSGDISQGTGGMVIPVGLRLEWGKPILKERRDYAGYEKEYGFYSPQVMLENLIILWALRMNGLKVENGRLKRVRGDTDEAILMRSYLANLNSAYSDMKGVVDDEDARRFIGRYAKYNEDGEPQYYDGITTIVNVPKDSALNSRFIQLIDRINTWQRDRKLFIATVPKDSAHMTIYDGVSLGDYLKVYEDELNEETRREIEEFMGQLSSDSRFTQEEDRRKYAIYMVVAKRIQEALREIRLERLPRFKPYKVIPHRPGMPKTSLVLSMVPETAEDLELLLRIQDAIVEKTGIKKPQDYIQHITLGYFVRPLEDKAEFNGFKQFIEDLNRDIEGINDNQYTFTLQDIILSFFPDMTRYHTLASFDLLNAVSSGDVSANLEGLYFGKKQGSHIVRRAQGDKEKSLYSFQLKGEWPEFSYKIQLRNALDRLEHIYGPGISTLVDEIQIVENLEGEGLYPSGRAPLASYEDGVLKIDELAFRYGEYLLFEELEHEFLESIAGLIPGSTHALADVVSTYRNVKRFLELSPDEQERFLAVLKGENPIDPDGEYLALLNMVKNRDGRGPSSTMAVVRYALRTKLYEKVRDELGLPDELARRIVDLDSRLDDALAVFNEISALDELTIKVIKTFTGIRVQGLDKISKKLAEIITALVKIASKTDEILRFTQDDAPQGQYYIVVDRNRVTEEMGEAIKKLEKNGVFKVVYTVPEDYDSKKIIHLVDPADLKEDMQEGILYLPMPYLRSSLYMAADIVSAGGEVAKVDPLVKGLIIDLYKITEEELMDLFNAPWRLLPKIQGVISELNKLKDAWAEIEKAA